MRKVEIPHVSNQEKLKAKYLKNLKAYENWEAQIQLKDILGVPLRGTGDLMTALLLGWSNRFVTQQTIWHYSGRTRILNDNDLYGEIPVQLTNCFSLTSLNFRNFSFNNLSGNVPLSKNFSRFPRERH